MSVTVDLDYELKSPIERVWHALTDPAALSRWMMFEADGFKPVVGHAFQLRSTSGWSGVIDCEVTEVDEPRRLSYTWATGGVTEAGHSTVVTWTLTEAGGGVTRLRLEQSGFRPEAKQEIGGARYGWKNMLDQLQGVLAAA